MRGGSAVLENCDDIKRSEHSTVEAGALPVTLLERVMGA